MTVFLLAALALIACTLLFILPPLLRREAGTAAPVARDELNLAVLRDQLRELDADLAAGTIDRTAYDSARLEIERRVVDEVNPQTMAPPAARRAGRTALGVALAVPLLACSLYVMLGAPLALQAGAGSPHAAAPESIETMVSSLAQRLQSQPDDIEGWHMLARSYNALERYTEASAAYAHLLTKTPNDADLLADYADTLAMVNNQSLQGEPEALINRALASNPNHIKALALAGSAAFERRDYQAAIGRWQKILELTPADSEIAVSTAGSLDQARRLLGQPATTATAEPAAASKPGAAASTARVAGTVELDAALRGKVADTDTVFIFARAAKGPRLPLAVLRKQVKDLPLAFMLDDSMAMTPDAKLSDFDSIAVGARISTTGNATPGPGEPAALIQTVPLGASDVVLRIVATEMQK